MKSFLLSLAILFSVSAHGFDSEPKRIALKRSLAQTGAWLRAHGIEQGWREFLRWEDLEKELSREESDVETLKEILNLWRKNNAGLEHPNFVHSQRALREFIFAQEIKAEGDLKTATEKRLQTLRELISTEPNTTAKEKIGPILGWLEFTGQHTVWVKKLRARWSKPNIQVHLSSNLISYSLNAPVKETKQSSMAILGMVMAGQSFTEGTVTAVPVASSADGIGIIELQFRAVVKAPHTYGSKGPVGIHSSSEATGFITKRVYFRSDDISANPARYSITNKNQVTQIDAPGRIVYRIARRKSDRKAGQAQEMAARLTGEELAREFDKKVDEQLRDLKRNQLQKFHDTVNFQGTKPASVHFQSDPSHLIASSVGANAYQLAASMAAPPASEGVDLSARVHESYPGNYLESYLGNKVEWDTSWFTIHKLLTAQEPRALRVHDRAPRWSLRVTEHLPMTVRFQNGAIHFLIRGVEITQADKSVKRPVEVRVKYLPVIQDGVVSGQRQGDVEVRYAADRPVDEAEESLRQMLWQKMDAFFPEHFDLGGLAIPKGSSWEKFEKLKAVRVEASNGWLSADYVLHVK